MNIKYLLRQINDENIVLDLLCVLVDYMIPLMVKANTEGLPQEGRTVTLSRRDWREQYDAGLNRCLGFDILWS